MAQKTLIDRIRKSFSGIRVKKSPESMRKSQRNKPKKQDIPKIQNENEAFSRSITNLLVKSAIDKLKQAEKKNAAGRGDEDENFPSSEESKSEKAGGYGAASGFYGGAGSISYADYKKFFSYLGKFKSQSSYQNLENNSAQSEWGLAESSGEFALVSKETMEKGSRYIKYFVPSGDINQNSSVPIAGMSSSEWEKFKLWMILDPVMYRLKTSTS